MKLIIDAVTGTILNTEGCFIVEENDILGEDLSDSEIAELAHIKGTRLETILEKLK